jgi:hypothetical protein
MTRGGKTCWKAIRVLGAGAEGRRELIAAERLAALYRFQNGDASPGHRFLDGHREAELHHPDQVDWATFPVLAALEAVTYDELRRLRMLLTDGAVTMGEPPKPHTESSPSSRAASAPSDL